MQKLKSLNKRNLVLIILPSVLKIVILFVFYIFGETPNNLKSKVFWLIFIAIVGITPICLNFFKKLKKWIAMLFLAGFQIGTIELLNPCEFKPIGFGFVLLTVFWVLGINLVVLFAVNRIFLTSVITNVVFLILGLINHYYYTYRGDPFEFSDIKLIGTAVTVLGEYDFFVDGFVLIAIMQTFFFTLNIYLSFRGEEKERRIKNIGMFLTAVACISTVFIYEMPILNMWDKTESVERYGYIYSSVVYADASFNTQEPENYSSEDTVQLLDSYNAQNTPNRPNIICIMNEAFSDLPDTYNFKTDVPLMPVFDSLKENTQKGWLQVSTFGGGTSNTEFEFLTNNSMAFMPTTSVPYVQYIKEEQQSIALYLKKLGYSTVAYHPYYRKGYNRDFVYPLIGFDKFYSVEDEFSSNTYIRWCLSDWSNYQNLFRLFEEKRAGEPIFLFNITMQNHGGYIAASDNVDVTVNASNIENAELSEYLSLVHASDAAIKDLIDYFSTVNENTIILFFGDHQPSLKEEVYLLFDNKFITEKHSATESKKQSKVPFFIWANFDIEEKENLCISANYLSLLLFENAGIPLTRYQQFLKELYTVFPVVSTYGYVESNQFYNWSNYSQNKLIDKYKSLVYANMFDKNSINIAEWLE